MEEQSVAVQHFLPFSVTMIMLAMGLGLAAGLLVIADGRIRP